MDVRQFAKDRSDDTERYARMTPEQRLALLLQLCDLTDAIQRARPDASALRQPTPLSAEAEQLWQRLIRRARDGR